MGSTPRTEITRLEQSRFQFTLRELLIAFVFVAVLLSIHVSTEGIVTRLVVPHTCSGIVALLLFGLSGYFAWKRSDCHNAFWILVIAWHFALIDTLWRLISTFTIIDSLTPPAWWLLAKYGLVLAGITLPVLCSIPTICLILSRIQKPLPRANTWFTAAAMVAFVDIAVIVFCTVAILGAPVSQDGTLHLFDHYTHYRDAK
ncbi:MAG: hypothetical protein HQ581_22935 [Planctomycetes bacterium]|nr:hypothetical protein [Planctomycetota bacterium]